MQFDVMNPVIIASDTLNVGLPVGEHAVVIAVNPNLRMAERYCIRVSEAADAVIKESQINRALDTGDRELFNRVSGA